MHTRATRQLQVSFLLLQVFNSWVFPRIEWDSSWERTFSLREVFRAFMDIFLELFVDGNIAVPWVYVVPVFLEAVKGVLLREFVCYLSLRSSFLQHKRSYPRILRTLNRWEILRQSRIPLIHEPTLLRSSPTLYSFTLLVFFSFRSSSTHRCSFLKWRKDFA